MDAKLIYQKIPAIMADVEAIGKDRKNEQQGYKFRGIDDIYNALHNIFAKHKVFITSEIVTAFREERATKSGGVLIYSIIDFKFSFITEDGSFVTTMQRGEAMDSGDKASNKAASVALKYALMQTLLIPTIEDKDTETQTPEIITFTAAMKAEVSAAKNESDLKKIWDKYKSHQGIKEFSTALTEKKLQLT